MLSMSAQHNQYDLNENYTIVLLFTRLIFNPLAICCTPSLPIILNWRSNLINVYKEMIDVIRLIFNKCICLTRLMVNAWPRCSAPLGPILLFQIFNVNNVFDRQWKTNRQATFIDLYRTRLIFNASAKYSTPLLPIELTARSKCFNVYCRRGSRHDNYSRILLDYSWAYRQDSACHHVLDYWIVGSSLLSSVNDDTYSNVSYWNDVRLTWLLLSALARSCAPFEPIFWFQKLIVSSVCMNQEKRRSQIHFEVVQYCHYRILAQHRCHTLEWNAL
jgi:hypothetical protein